MNIALTPEFLSDVARQNLEIHLPGRDVTDVDEEILIDRGLILPEAAARLKIMPPGVIIDPVEGLKKASGILSDRPEDHDSWSRARSQPTKTTSRRVRGRKRPLTKSQVRAMEHEIENNRLKLDIIESPDSVQ